MNQERKLELVFYTGASLLEGPHWDAQNELLYTVSIEDHQIYSYHPTTQEVKSYPTEGPVGCAVVEKNGMILEAEQSGIYRFDPQTHQKHFVAQPKIDERMRYNDGKLDPKGRLVVGTMALEGELPHEATVFVMEPDGESKILIGGVTLANGLAWTEDEKTLYFIDTPTKKVKAYTYDPIEATATYERDVFEVQDDSNPDGMCIAPDGTLYVAHYGGGRVSHIDPSTGELLDEIKLPVTNVTSCCIGGADRNELYITTAKNGDDYEMGAGGLFRVKL